MKRIITILLAAAILLTFAACGAKEPAAETQPQEEVHTPVADPISDNYRTYYQIFVGSFSDSNGDGIYEAVVPAGYANVIFCRMKQSCRQEFR